MAEVAFRDYLNEIDGLIEHGSIEPALQHCRHILTQYPKAVEVYRLLGKALLEQVEDRAAQDVFQRVLSVDPEDFVARVGLSIIHDRNGELEPAIWHMERAFEIAPSNGLIQGELRRLYARRDGNSPERIPLTRGALARMYAAGDLNSEAITDLRQLLGEQSDRIDLQVQLAEVLWRDDQRVEAAERTQQITTTLPYCLKANLILGAILRASNANGESDEPLQRAQAVDPENDYAHRLFSGMGPLYRATIMVDHLELMTMDQMLEAPLPMAETEEVPDWLRGISDLEQPQLEEPESMGAARLSPGLHMPDVATEVPDWLQGLTGETGAAEAEVPDWLAALTGAAVAGAAVEAVSDRDRQPDEAAVEAMDETVPDWISQLGRTGTLSETEELPPEEEEPAWMAQLREEPPSPFSEQIPAQLDSESPDWLSQLQASQPTLEAESTEGKEPDWLSQLRASSGEVETAEKAGPALGPGALAAGLAGLAGVAAHAASEGGKEESATASKLESPQAVMPTSETGEAEVDQSLSSGFPAPAAETEVPEEMPSSDDALAFLAKLAAGKEDQLRAQAQEEADVRMAEIMGRRPTGAEPAPTPEDRQAPIKMTVSAATVAAVAAALAAKSTKPEEEPTEPQAVEAVPEEMPSSDDALAFLSKLAAGKEDQLRAQAEQEAEARMAAIMGRKPSEVKAVQAAPEEHPAAGLAAASLGAAAIAAGVSATRKEETPVEVPEEMPSSDDALAFLSRLAAGKEDQLRAQAEQEAEARMAAIMGRSAPLGPAQPIETASTTAAIEAEETIETTEPAAQTDLPDWLKTMRPTQEVAGETPESDLPEWLRAMRPSDESAERGLAALIEADTSIEETPIEELPDWLRAQQLEETSLEEVKPQPKAPTMSAAEAAVALGLLSAAGEKQPIVEEKPPAPKVAPELTALDRAAAPPTVATTARPPTLPQTSALLPLDWWTQTASDTGEELLPALPQPYLSPRARAAEKEKAAASAAPTAATKPSDRKLPQTGPLRQTGPLILPQTGPLGVPEPAAVSAEVETLLSRVYQDQKDHAARLDLARTYWATGDREGAYTEYLALVNAGEYTKETMADLETIVYIHDQTDWHRMLGDVYMKAGRLSSALEHYRRALSEV